MDGARSSHEQAAQAGKHIMCEKPMALDLDACRRMIAAAEAAQNDAARLVSGSQDDAASVPEAFLSDVNFPAKAFYLLSAIGLCSSSSEARRQIKGGAVRLDGEKITDPNLEFTDSSLLMGKVLQVGKKTFRRLMR